MTKNANKKHLNKTPDKKHETTNYKLNKSERKR